MKLNAFNHLVDAKRQQRRQSVLLAIVLAVLMALLLGYWQLDRRVQTMKATMADVRGNSIDSDHLQRNRPSSTSMTQEISTVNQAVYEINTPWLLLLSQLEGQQSPDVKLLFLAPDIKQKRVRLVLEASSVDAMAEYLSQIAKVKCLKRPVLLNQQTIPTTMAVHFTLEGQWLI